MCMQILQFYLLHPNFNPLPSPGPKWRVLSVEFACKWGPSVDDTVNKQANKQTNRQTNKQTEKMTEWDWYLNLEQMPAFYFFKLFAMAGEEPSTINYVRSQDESTVIGTRMNRGSPRWRQSGGRRSGRPGLTTTPRRHCSLAKVTVSDAGSVVAAPRSNAVQKLSSCQASGFSVREGQRNGWPAPGAGDGALWKWQGGRIKIPTQTGQTGQGLKRAKNGDQRSCFCTAHRLTTVFDLKFWLWRWRFERECDAVFLP